MRKFGEIIERIEYVRNYLGLNKSRFSAEIGMKPQTYNNFIGAQGSKPNVELIYGIVTRFEVNPHWLLGGSGEMFSEGQSPLPRGTGERVREGAAGQAKSQAVRELQEQLKGLEPVIKETEKRIRAVETSQVPLMDALIRVFGRYIEVDPVGATREIKELVARLESRLNQLP